MAVSTEDDEDVPECVEEEDLSRHLGYLGKRVVQLSATGIESDLKQD